VVTIKYSKADQLFERRKKAVANGVGVVSPEPHKHLEDLRGFCDEHDIMLIFNEIQSDFCRIGIWPVGKINRA
jgi:adenosylmethionine-8-amino-7-oxononanoate aminotransferase